MTFKLKPEWKFEQWGTYHGVWDIVGSHQTQWRFTSGPIWGHFSIKTFTRTCCVTGTRRDREVAFGFKPACSPSAWCCCWWKIGMVTFFLNSKTFQDPYFSSEKMGIEYERESKSGLEPGERGSKRTTECLLIQWEAILHVKSTQVRSWINLDSSPPYTPYSSVNFLLLLSLYFPIGKVRIIVSTSIQWIIIMIKKVIKLNTAMLSGSLS